MPEQTEIDIDCEYSAHIMRFLLQNDDLRDIKLVAKIDAQK